MDTPAVKLGFCLMASLYLLAFPASAHTLIVVEDRGGEPALPFYKVFKNAGRMPSQASRQAVPPSLLIYQTQRQEKSRTLPQFDAGMPHPPRKAGP